MVGKFNHLEEQIQYDIQHFINEVITMASDRLLSIIMYGNATDENFDVRVSSVNFLIILTEIEKEFLSRYAIASKEFSQYIAIPLFLTPVDIQSSVSILPLEFLALKESYVLIYGDDYLEKVEIDVKDLRVELEQEVKRRLIRLREEFIESYEKKDHLERLLTSSLMSFVPLFRNILRLVKSNTSITGTLFSEFCEAFHLNQKPFFDIWDIKAGNKKIDRERLSSLFGDYLSQIEALSRSIHKYFD